MKDGKGLCIAFQWFFILSVSRQGRGMFGRYMLTSVLDSTAQMVAKPLLAYISSTPKDANEIIHAATLGFSVSALTAYTFPEIGQDIAVPSRFLQSILLISPGYDIH